MAAKVSKKELKEPDFLQVEFRKLVDFVIHHQTKVYILLALILLGVIISSGWYFYRLNYNKSALKLYNQVETSALTNNPPGDQVKLLQGFKNVTVTYPNSRAAIQSYYKLGNLYLSTNQIDESIKAYDEFLKRTTDKDYLKIFAYTGKAYCYEIKKDYKNALKFLDNALKTDTAHIFEAQIYRDMGRIYEGINDLKKALEYYRKSLEKTTDPTMNMIVKRKIAELS